ncbi:virulence plasmid 28 protein [Pseudomonas syringae]|nr:virulence plasmid 28 protein [Pseudomonas syringae]MCF5068072.1 virulence plasmid 28 protein [Pseudomonas syringae]
MADARPASQLLSQVFSEEQLAQYANLATYLKDGGSILPLVEKGVHGLARDYNLSPDDARQFLRRANSMAVYLRRQFIEHTLYGDSPQVFRARSGFTALISGPSFEGLFSPKFESMCPPDALESITSPVAYLIELLRWIEDRIEAVGSAEEKYRFKQRRQDLAALAVDFNAVHQSVSAVDIIVKVLETFIEKQEPDVQLEQSLIDARYPNGLPYYQHWVTVDAVARHHGMSVGNFAHMVDINFPYFLQDQAWDDDAGRALTHATRLGPYQRTLLTEAAPEIDDRDEFYVVNFGAAQVTWQNLNQVAFFGQRTKLDTPGLEALLSVRAFAPTRSPNVSYSLDGAKLDGVAESGYSGSVYINANAFPGIEIVGSDDGFQFLHKLDIDPIELEGLRQFDRLNRKLRLDQWLDLPSDQVDALLAAAIRADCRETPEENKWLISENVIHALGLFQSLRERYDCTAQDFAAFIDEVSLYGRGETLSQFDQIFNGQGDYRQPLVLDNEPFPILPAQGQPDLTVTQICSGLAIDLKTYAYLAVTIAGAQGKADNLLRDAPTLSAFYRLVKLPTLLGITPVEGVLMLSLLGGKGWVDGLAGIPGIGSDAGVPDALNLIYAMHSCAGWCTDRKLPMLWILQQVAPPQAPTVPGETETRLFEQVLNLLPGSLFTNTALLMAGVPVLPGASWLDLLTVLVDPDGLVIGAADVQGDYPTFVRTILNQAVRDGLGEIDSATRALIVEQMFTVLMQAQEAQVSLVKETLAVYAGINAEQALLVLAWANATVYQLLRQVSERSESGLEGVTKARWAPADPLLVLLADLRRRSAIVTRFELSAELLQDYLNYGHKAWLNQDDKHAFTVRTLYYLTVLARAFELSEQPASKLLAYLREVDALPDPLTPNPARIAQEAAAIRLAEFFDWSVQEVRECVDRIAPQYKILRSLIELDLLMRIRVLSAHTGMDALTIFLMGRLPEVVDKDSYKDAAEHALPSLTETAAPVLKVAEDLKQIVSMTCEVDQTEVVANQQDAPLTFTVTLKDIAGKPLTGVNVYWRAVLGTLATVATDSSGQAKATFIPGKVMGTDTPMFWLDLLEPEYAPTIQVIADKDTLQFPPPLMSPVPLGVVAFGGEIELYATLMDRYQNLGINSLVDWTFEALDSDIESPTLIIRPAQGLTNQEGVTRVFVSSPSGGRFKIEIIISASNTKSEFEPITFAPAPDVP